MVTRDEMVQSALRHSHRSVGRAFCKALGVLHLIGRPREAVACERERLDGLMECFMNKANPNDIRFRKEV